MPKARQSGRIEHFVVGPWQSKKISTAPSNAQEVYSEVFIPLGAQGESATDGEPAAGGETLSTDSSGTRRPIADQPDQPKHAGEIESRLSEEAPDAYDSDLDRDNDNPAASLGTAHIPSFSGTATIAVPRDLDAGLSGQVTDSAGRLLAEFHSKRILARQECTRDDDWSLHLIRFRLPRGDSNGGVSALQVLAECTGEDAIRLRAPPAAHGAEEDVALLLRGRGPIHDVHLEFDCGQIWGAMSEQAQAAATKLCLGEGAAIEAINTGILTLGPLHGPSD